MTDTTNYFADVGALVGDRRQRIVAVVHERGRTVTVDELADAVAEWETDRGLNSDWADLHQHLYEVDLPALHDAELLVFDPEEGIVDARRTVTDDWPPTEEGPAGRFWPAYVVVAAGVGVAAAATLNSGVPASALWAVWAAGTLSVLVLMLAVDRL
ncbi:MAG: hypothetical protein ABEJ06_02495 [Haloarculaceae archaeon]